jgi:hypothetical protein
VPSNGERKVREINEQAEIDNLTTVLEGLIDDASTSEEERHKAELILKMLKLKPFQQ